MDMLLTFLLPKAQTSGYGLSVQALPAYLPQGMTDSKKKL